MEKLHKLEGSLVALVTPMICSSSTSEDLIHFDSLEQLIEWHIAEGTQGLVVAGTTGEGPTLSSEEWAAVVRCSVSVVRGRLPVIAGAGTNCTRTSIERTLAAKALGADGSMVVCPYYNKPTQEGMFQHFKRIADACPDFPILLYNVPGRTVADIQPSTVSRLASTCPNIFGIKEASGQVSRVGEIRKSCGLQFRIFSGEDGEACEAILQGANGVISVTANIFPRQNQKMCALALSQQSGESKTLDATLQPIHGALFIEPNPTAVKWLLAHIGKIPYGGLRLPLLPLSSFCHVNVLEAFRIAACTAEENLAGTKNTCSPILDENKWNAKF